MVFFVDYIYIYIYILGTALQASIKELEREIASRQAQSKVDQTLANPNVDGIYIYINIHLDHIVSETIHKRDRSRPNFNGQYIYIYIDIYGD